MCLAIPGRLIEVVDEEGLKMGRVDFSGNLQRVCLEYVPGAEVGQYVLIHAGFAISILDEAEAEESLALWRELAEHEAQQDA